MSKWPEDFKPWLRAVTAAKTTPLDCMVAVVISQHIAKGQHELTVDDINGCTMNEAGSIGSSIRKLKSLGLLLAIDANGAHRKRTFQLVIPEAVASAAH